MVDMPCPMQMLLILFSWDCATLGGLGGGAGSLVGRHRVPKTWAVAHLLTGEVRSWG